MKKYLKATLITPLFLMLSFICLGNAPDSIPCQFDVNGYGTIEFDFKNASDSMALITDFVTLLPPVYVDSDPMKFKGNGKFFLSLRIMMPQKVNFRVYFLSPKLVKSYSDTLLYSVDHYTTCYVVPNDTLHISIDFSMREPLPVCFKYSGTWSQLSDYYKNRGINYSDKEFKDIIREALKSASDFESFVKIIDSVTKSEINYFKSYNLQHTLPKWFVNFAESDPTYSTYTQKLFEPEMLGISKPIPKNYYNFLTEHPLNNKAAILSNNYYDFLNYNFQNSQPPFSASTYEDTSFITNRIVHLISYCKKNLEVKVSDLLLAYMLDTQIDRHVTQGDFNLYYNEVQNPDIKQYLEKRYINKYMLKEGDAAPPFYLKNNKNENVTLKSFSGYLVYLTFWFTGCKPCIKDIPNENHLVDVFKDEKVKFVSICMFSSEESWRECIDKYGIKSIPLICNGNSDKILKEKYNVSSYPHYAIIDKHGKIIINKWRNPSTNAEEEIRKCLAKD